MVNQEVMSQTAGSDSTRPRQPPSRLRRALDIARQAAAESAPEDTRTSEPSIAAEAAETEPTNSEMRSENKGRLRAIGSAWEAGEVASVRQRRTGRGLDALIPPDPATSLDRDDTWDNSAQGWVQTPSGDLEWRPIIASTATLDRWAIATYLGIVSSEVVADAPGPGSDLLALARNEALRRLAAIAVARGAHAVVGVVQDLVVIERGYLVTITGTAVTLNHRR